MHMMAAESPGPTSIPPTQARPATSQQPVRKLMAMRTGQVARVESAHQPVHPAQTSDSEVVTNRLGWFISTGDPGNRLAVPSLRT